MQDISKAAYGFATLLYGIVAAYIWYLSYSLWLFLGKNYFPQNVSSVLSIQNSSFTIVHIAVSAILTTGITTGLIFYPKLRNFFLEVGEELSCVAWPSFKEARHSTLIVILLVLVVGFILFFADTIFLKFIHLILKTAA